MCSDRSLVFRKPPPSRASLRTDARPQLTDSSMKKWGDLSGPRDVSDISRLKPFEGTNFSYLYNRGQRSGPLGRIQVEKTGAKRAHKILDSEKHQDHDEHRQKRRRTVGNATTTLHDVIPQPHYHPYSATATNYNPSSDITKYFPPFSKAPFRPIPPFSHEQSEGYFKDPYARSAWVIPASGDLPWREASSARLEAETKFSKLVTKKRLPSPLCVSWTPFVIKKFWSDLLKIRERGALGAISLSFHVSKQTSVQIQVSKVISHQRSEARRDTGESLPGACRPECLDQCTYIKVYHDMRYSMYVRAVLDAWRTETEVLGDSVMPNSIAPVTKSRPFTGRPPEPKKTKVRPLQGATLPLLDETGQAIGLC